MSQQCPFCNIEQTRIIFENKLCYAMHDGFPVSSGHSLVIPKRHMGSFFEASADEKNALIAMLDAMKNLLTNKFKPDAFNIGINDGAAAGQTVPHLHIHLIPRYKGDMADPRGGVRWVIPEKAKYW
jgi:diadenosine tetraphosphate (Ap4A) HIT family hydrolase